MLNLKDRSLLRCAAYIDGVWREVEGGASIEVKNPAS